MKSRFEIVHFLSIFLLCHRTKGQGSYMTDLTSLIHDLLLPSSNYGEPVVKVNPLNYGEPVNLMWINENNTEIIDFLAIDNIFLHAEVFNRTIVAFSITGPIKLGKTFFMNYCLRFMYANVSQF
jgi:hypothetical protein